MDLFIDVFLKEGAFKTHSKSTLKILLYISSNYYYTQNKKRRPII